MTITDRIKHGWNAFINPDNLLDQVTTNYTFGGGGYNRASSNYLHGSNYNKGDLVKAVISRIALDASMVDIKHLKINPDTGNQTPQKSGLINAITYDANLDQTGRAFMYDLFWSCLDEGVIAAVPIETDSEPTESGAYDIKTIRVGKIVQWLPQAVRVQVYNEFNGQEQDLIIDKHKVAIIESPLYALLKEGNQTLRLLEQKIRLMYSEDNKAATGKLNGLIQLSYATKSDSRKKYADDRLNEINKQRANNPLGLAMLDVNEKYISTGAGINNNLLDDIRKLQQDFYNQTGLTSKVIDGSADEKEMMNYYNRTVDPLVTAVLDEFNRKFITNTAHTQGHIIKAYRDPFKLVPVEQLATIVDTFTRNAVFTPNESREIVGKQPHPDPLADKLYNRNIADANQIGGTATVGQTTDPNLEEYPEEYSEEYPEEYSEEPVDDTEYEDEDDTEVTQSSKSNYTSSGIPDNYEDFKKMKNKSVITQRDVEANGFIYKGATTIRNQRRIESIVEKSLSR